MSKYHPKWNWCISALQHYWIPWSLLKQTYDKMKWNVHSALNLKSNSLKSVFTYRLLWGSSQRLILLVNHHHSGPKFEHKSFWWVDFQAFFLDCVDGHTRSSAFLGQVNDHFPHPTFVFQFLVLGQKLANREKQSNQGLTRSKRFLQLFDLEYISSHLQQFFPCSKIWKQK